jgi:tRNA pseudouridine55 synthase
MINKNKDEIVELLEKEEILLINKPKGISSFDCIRILQKIYKEKTGKKIKIGHAGTLDPNAIGLLILGIKNGTKKLTELISNNKTYEATIQLGIKTDTEDIDGKVLEIWDEKMLKHFFVQENINKDKIENVMNSLLGEKEYIVPSFSAIKVNGKKLYEIARKETLPKLSLFRERLTRKMIVLEISNFKFDFPVIKVTFKVSKGTYIRSLSTKIGEILKIPTTLSDLNRTSIGEFKLENAINLPKENIMQILEMKSKRKINCE